LLHGAWFLEVVQHHSFFFENQLAKNQLSFCDSFAKINSVFVPSKN